MDPTHLERLTLFPLPNAVFFPNTLLPLHIFEARYLAMIEDAVEAGRPIAVVLLKPGFEEDYGGQPDICLVAGVGDIIHCERLDDGRYNVILRGIARVRILEEHPLHSRGYRSARAELVEDIPPDEDALRESLTTLRGFVFALGASRPKLSALISNRLNNLPEPGALADNVASMLLVTQDLRQAVLEEPDVLRRLDAVNSALTEMMLEDATDNPNHLN